MRNTIGHNLTLTLFGESHQDSVGAVLDGFEAGLKIDFEFINQMLSKRRPTMHETPRVELDEYEFVSGVYNGYTTGSSICVLVKNKSVKSSDYDLFSTTPRPSHADYVSYVKYKGFSDYRGGGHFSGRLTSAIVICGSIVLQALKKQGINIGTHILSCGNFVDKNAIELVNKEELDNFINAFSNKNIPVYLDLEDDIMSLIKEIKESKNSIGAKIQTIITGLKAGYGEPWFSSIEGELSNAMFSIGGIKGVEFGKGFGFCDLLGDEANDEFIVLDGVVSTNSNNAGGINGGISNGMPIVFNCAVKPTSTIGIAQKTVNLKTFKNDSVLGVGRHDPAIFRRICPVVDALTAIVIYDFIRIA